MIWESGPWKEELANISESLKSFKPNEDPEGFFLEKNCFLAAYIVIKLLNSHKLSDELKRECFKITAYKYNPLEGCRLDIFNTHKWPKFYDLEKPIQENRSLQFICDQLRHSYVFGLECDEQQNRYTGFFFNSDYTKHKKLFYIDLQGFTRLIGLVSSDRIISGEYHYNRNTGQREITRASRAELIL